VAWGLSFLLVGGCASNQFRTANDRRAAADAEADYAEAISKARQREGLVVSPGPAFGPAPLIPLGPGEPRAIPRELAAAPPPMPNPPAGPPREMSPGLTDRAIPGAPRWSPSDPGSMLAGPGANGPAPFGAGPSRLEPLAEAPIGAGLAEPGYRPSRSSAVPPSRPDVDFEGQVVNSQGEPEPGAVVEIREVRPPRPMVAEVVSDRTGRFRVRFLDPGVDYQLIAVARGAGRRFEGSAVATPPAGDVVIQVRATAESGGFAAVGNRTGSASRLDGADPRGLADPLRSGPLGDPLVGSGRSNDGLLAAGGEPTPPIRRETRGSEPRAVPPGEPDRVLAGGRSPDGSPLRTFPSRDGGPTDRSSVSLADSLNRGAAPARETPRTMPPDPRTPEPPGARAAAAAGPVVGAAPSGFRPAFAGSPLESLTVLGLDGRPRAMANLKGDLILLDFMGSWCGPCRQAVPRVNDLDRRFAASGVTVVGVACERGTPDEALDAASEARDELRIAYPLVVDPLNERSPLRETLRIKSFPTLVLLDRDGRELAREVGGSAEGFRKIEDAIRRALANR
jgi:thiol-disulfide isomerase/thioredoxin